MEGYWDMLLTDPLGNVVKLSEQAVNHAVERHGLYVRFGLIEDVIVNPDAIYRSSHYTDRWIYVRFDAIQTHHKTLLVEVVADISKQPYYVITAYVTDYLHGVEEEPLYVKS